MTTAGWEHLDIEQFWRYDLIMCTSYLNPHLTQQNMCCLPIFYFYFKRQNLHLLLNISNQSHEEIICAIHIICEVMLLCLISVHPHLLLLVITFVSNLGPSPKRREQTSYQHTSSELCRLSSFPGLLKAKVCSLRTFSVSASKT